MRSAIVMLVLAAASSARADDAADTKLAATAQPYHHAISVQLATIGTAAIAIVGEHDLRWNKLSVAVALGARTGAHGDYDSRTLGAGVEVRRWLRRPTTMRGWYVAARTDVAATRIEDMVEHRSVGSLVTWSVGAAGGYRFVIADRVEITPSVGMGVVVEGGMMPTTSRVAGMLGLTAGVVF